MTPEGTAALIVALTALVGVILTWLTDRHGHKANALKAQAETDRIRLETAVVVGKSERDLADYYRQEVERLLGEIEGLRREVVTLQSMIASMAATISNLGQQLQKEKEK